MIVANNIRKLRKISKMSQQEVSDMLGVDRNTYASWESEKTDIKSEYIPQLADIFGVSIGELFKCKSSKIEVNQKVTDNKDSSINGIVVLITDKEAVNELVKVFKEMRR